MAINIYQVLTRLFHNPNSTNRPYGTLAQNGCSKFNHFTPQALESLKSFGITHIWFTGVIRHASCTAYPEHGIESDNPLIVKGIAGSPYAIKDYFDVSPDLAERVPSRMAEFEALVDRCHQQGLRVIIDFVPNHVCRAYQGAQRPQGIPDLGETDNHTLPFSPRNNFYYLPGHTFTPPDGIDFPYTRRAPKYIESPAKVTGNNAFTPKPTITDWYETVKLNYGVDHADGGRTYFDEKPNTWRRMREVLEFWAAKGVDGFRCDMAEMVPVEFWKWVIPRVRRGRSHIIFIGEIYTPSEYRRYLYQGGFDYLYDKVGLYDTLRHIMEGKAQAWQITDCWKAQEGYSQRMLRFMENHDEQRIASPQLAGSPWAAVPAMIVLATMHSGPLMIYFGQEIGERGDQAEGFSGRDGRTTIFDYWCLKEYEKWVNGGRFDGALLSPAQGQLRAFYQQLLHIRLRHAAIAEGNFYDLMWANQGDSLFAQQIFAYLRYTPEQLLLVVVNFDRGSPKPISIRIPDHALDITRMSEVSLVRGRDLLGGRPDISFTPSQAASQGITMALSPTSGAIFELQLAPGHA